MTSCEWRICHAANVSSQRSNAPRGGIVSGEFGLQASAAMGLFLRWRKLSF
jgi:hypothetical protein